MRPAPFAMRGEQAAHCHFHLGSSRYAIAQGRSLSHLCLPMECNIAEIGLRPKSTIGEMPRTTRQSTIGQMPLGPRLAEP